MCQRFAFENLSPERQMAVMDERRRQQIQRQMLEDQIAERQRAREAQETKRRPSEDPPRATRRSAGFPTTDSSSSQSFTLTAPLLSTPDEQPLLMERKFALRDRPALSMSLNPARIHDAFATLRNQISTGSGQFVRTAPVQSVRKRALTFSE
jgi:hypothetical protein